MEGKFSIKIRSRPIPHIPDFELICGLHESVGRIKCGSPFLCQSVCLSHALHYIVSRCCPGRRAIKTRNWKKVAGRPISMLTDSSFGWLAGSAFSRRCREGSPSWTRCRCWPSGLRRGTRGWGERRVCRCWRAARTRGPSRSRTPVSCPSRSRSSAGGECCVDLRRTRYSTFPLSALYSRTVQPHCELEGGCQKGCVGELTAMLSLAVRVKSLILA